MLQRSCWWVIGRGDPGGDGRPERSPFKVPDDEPPIREFAPIYIEARAARAVPLLVLLCIFSEEFEAKIPLSSWSPQLQIGLKAIADV